MDLTPTIVPKSDQLNAEDFLAGPKTVTITAVTKGNAQQPVNVVTEEFGPSRPYKPAKSMRRLMVAAWGADTSNYPGRQLTLFRDPAVRFGDEAIGGIRISHMSHLAEQLSVSLTVTRGHRQPWVVQPIVTEQPKDTSGREWLTELAQAEGDADLIFALGKAAKMAHASEPIMRTLTVAYTDAKGSQS